MSEVITQGRWAGMLLSDWTDMRLESLSDKLDASKKDPALLEPWMRGTIFAIFKEAKATGPSYRFSPKRMRQVRDILKTQSIRAVLE